MCEFIIVGKDSDYINKLKVLCKELKIEEKVRFVGYVPDEDLPTLYNKAIAFVYPTLYEGFGLPILEAMACGTVVLCSNNSSLPEVYGDAAISFDANDIQEIEKSMNLILSNKDESIRLIELSKKRIAMFNWNITANEIIKLFNEMY